jgi:hypothetical protein
MCIKRKAKQQWGGLWYLMSNFFFASVEGFCDHVMTCPCSCMPSFSPYSFWWWSIFAVSLYYICIHFGSSLHSSCNMFSQIAMNFDSPVGCRRVAANLSLCCFPVTPWCEHGKIIEINVLTNLNPQFLRFTSLTVSTLVVRAGPRHAGTLDRPPQTSVL